MGLGEQAERHLALSAPQRRVVGVLLLVLLVWCTVRYIREPTFIANPQPALGARAGELADRIDPNTADWAALAVLPSIGEKRARDIVAYRERVRERGPDVVAFRSPEDLLKIGGIGYATMLRLTPYLRFDDVPVPATRPASGPVP